MLALLLVQILGLPFCLMYIKLAGKSGARVMVGVGICIYMGICVVRLFVRETGSSGCWPFWWLPGRHRLSRSMFENASGQELFGVSTSAFFDIFGKFSSVMGPALMGFVTQIATVVLLGRQSLTPETAPRGRVGRRAAGGIAVGRIVSSAHLPGGRGALLRRAAPHAEKKRARRKKSVLPMCGRGGAPPEDPNAKGFDRYARSIYTYPHRPRGAGTKRGEHAPSTAAYEMGANGPDPLFAYRVLSAKRPWPLPELGGRMHDEQCGRFLRTMIFAASTPAQRSYALGFGALRGGFRDASVCGVPVRAAGTVQHPRGARLLRGGHGQYVP